MNRYLIGILACVGLSILLLVLLFGGGHKKATPSTPITPPMVLPDYANTSAQVEMLVTGPIVAPQNHNNAVITIDQYNAKFDLIQGYDGHVINSKVYSNTENSYSSFLYALYYAGFSTVLKSNYTKSTGICPTGSTYNFYLNENGNTLQHSWITACPNDPKTYGGNFSLTLTLFKAQIPDIGALTSNANF